MKELEETGKVQNPQKEMSENEQVSVSRTVVDARQTLRAIRQILDSDPKEVSSEK